MDLLVQRFAIKTAVVETAVAVDEKKHPSTAEKKVNLPPASLPVLAGIVISRLASGTESRLALLDDGVFSEGDRLQDLTIRKISADGVLLAKDKKTWFLKRPEIAYSLSKH